MSVFVDTGILVGASLVRDRRHDRAAEILTQIAEADPFTTDHVIVEAWALLNRRAGHSPAMRFWHALRGTPLRIEAVTLADLERAEAIADAWADQEFDIVDCTSFTVIERMGCRQAATFDVDFAVYRLGAERSKALEIFR